MFESILKKIRRLLKFILLGCIDAIAIRRQKNIVPNTLLLIRLDTIGDYVLFRNFIEVLKNKFKDYKITLCGNVIWKDLAEVLENHLVSDFVWISQKDFTRNFKYRFKILQDINKKGFEVAIQPTFSRNFYLGDAVIRASVAKQRIGSVGDLTNIRAWEKRISDRYYTKRLGADEKNLFEFDRNREFFEQLLEMDIHISKPYIDMRKTTFGLIPNKSYVVIFPGGSERFRKWDPGNFAEIADFIVEKYNLEIIIAGSSDDKTSAEKIRQKCKSSNITDFTGKTTLSELTKLLAEATLLISNETGAVHLAVAVNAKGICISNGNHFGRFNPYPKRIYQNIYYVYPPIIMQNIKNVEYLSWKYRYGSRLNIGTVRVEDVKKILEAVMGNKSSALHQHV